MRRALARWAVMGAGALVWAALPGRAGAEGVLVFAAASLTNVLDRIGAAWTARSGHAVVLSYAGSSALARQIQAGAPADVFISASRDWIEALVASGDVQPASVRDVANRLVLIAHGSQADPVVLDRDLDLAALLGDGRLSVALVESWPSPTMCARPLPLSRRARRLWASSMPPMPPCRTMSRSSRLFRRTATRPSAIPLR